MGDLIEARKLTRFFDLGGNQRVHAVDKVSLYDRRKGNCGAGGRERLR